MDHKLFNDAVSAAVVILVSVYVRRWLYSVNLEGLERN